VNKYAEHSKWKESRGCVRKQKYATAKEAKTAVELRGLGLGSFYKCCFCDGWHISKQSPKADRKS
jgi:hypothetical protein